MMEIQENTLTANPNVPRFHDTTYVFPPYFISQNDHISLI